MKIIKDFFDTFTIPIILGVFCGVYYDGFAVNNLMQFGYLDTTEIRIMAWIVGIWMFGIPLGFRTVKRMEKKDREKRRRDGDDTIVIYPIVLYFLLKLWFSFAFSPIFSLIHIISFIYRTVTRPFKGYNATT